MNIFYKASIILSLAICVASILQSHQLRTQIKELKATITNLEDARSILSLESREDAIEVGYKQCIIDAQIGKSRYIVTQANDGKGLSLWKLEKTIDPKKE